MTPSSITHPKIHRAIACALAVLLLGGSLAPTALAASSAIAGAAGAAPACPKGQIATAAKKRVRVWKKVRRHGKVRRKRVWVNKRVFVCATAPATAPTAKLDTQAPSTPGGLLAAAGSGQVTLVWNPSTDDVGVTGYQVFRDGQLIASPTSAFYTDSAVTNGTTYAYSIVALDAAGHASAGATVTATPKSTSDVTAPTAPPSLTATAGDRQVSLSWGASTDNVAVTYYKVFRDGAPIASQDARTFTDTALSNGTTYTYTVIAYDAAGNASAASTATATPADTTAPSVPAGLAATPGDTQVSLTWTDSTDNVAVTGYKIYRDNVLIASPATAYYLDTGLVNGVQHAYKVAAVDGSANASATTAVVNATPNAPSGSDTTPPSNPTNLAGTPGLNSASLTWTASTDNVGVTGYKVYRGGVLVGSPAGTSFSESGLTNAVAYLYTVKAVDAAGNLSGASNQVSVTPADTQAPTVPTGIMLTQVAATHSITVSWTASTDNVAVQKYRVYRNGTLVGQPTTTTYSDTGLGNGATYSYRIAAVDAAGNASAQSPAVSTYVS